MMRYIWSMVVVAVAGLLGLTGVAERNTGSVEAAEKAVSYAKDVQPILQTNCYGCHNNKKKKANVDLQTNFAGVQKIVSPAKPDESRLFKCLIGKGAKLMPPKNPLPEEQIAMIKSWITAGAKEK